MKNLILVFVLGLTACGLKEKADDMADTSNSIHEDTSHMADGMSDTKRGLALSASFEFTKKQINEIYAWTGEVLKTGDAGAFILGAYFQTWNAGYHEDIAELDDRLARTIEWMITQMLQHMTNLTVDATPWGDYKGSSSIAVELERTQASFDRAVAAAGMPGLNLYRVILDSLRQCVVEDPKYPFPAARDQVCQYVPEFIYLLQLRQNYLPMLVISRTTSFSDQTWKRVIFRTFETTIPAKQISLSELKQWAYWLNAAKQTQRDLRSLCEDPIVNTTFQSYVDNYQLGPAFTKVTHAHNPEFSRARGDFLNAVAKMRDRDQLHALSASCK